MTSRPAAQGPIERLLARLMPRPESQWLPIYCALSAVALAILGAFDLADGDSSAIVGVGIVLMAITGALATTGARASRAQAITQSTVTVMLLVAEGVIYASTAVWIRANEDVTGPLALSFVAFAGALLLTYAHARILASAHLDLPDGPLGLASRDVRLIVLAAGVALEQAYVALIVVAALAHGAVLLHLLRLRLSLRD